jgi:hypothetical protein
MNPDLNERDMKQPFQNEDPLQDSGAEDSESEKPARRSGRRKIKIEYIEDKNRRHITFSKRKAGIMKKAYELSTLTGTQVLLLVVSETGLVYTFTTVKLQPIVTKPEGKNLIQACLNAPDPSSNEQTSGDASYGNTSPQLEDKKSVYEDSKSESGAVAALPAPPAPQQTANYSGNGSSNYPSYSQPPPSNSSYSYPGYMSSQGGAPYPPQPQQPTGYSQMPQPGYYSQQQQPPQGYWQQQPQPGNPALQRQSPIMDDKTRNGPKK